jgi:large subunit ribosomal protein L28
MPGVCEYCQRKPVTGVSYVRRGLAKAKGGVGRRITGKTKRQFKANLQRVKVTVNGRVMHIRVCTQCLRSGKVVKAA